jgi:4-carboxymuconolactone decarboxylase
LSFAQDIADVLRRPGGAPEVRCLALLHGAACAGRFDAVPALLQAGATLGLPPTDPRLAETALQVVAYGGFPRAIELLTHLRRARAEASHPAATAATTATAAASTTRTASATRPAAPPPVDPGILAAQGRRVWDAIYKDLAEDVLASLDDLSPGFSRIVLEDAYGRLLARPGLSLAERELLAVAALALMALPAPLGSHIRGALRNGSNAPAVMDILDTCRILADPAALAVLAQAQDRLSRSVYRS